MAAKANVAVSMDWSKFVVIDPPAYLSFTKHDDDERPYTHITIANKSGENLIFKVKTTKPANYLVRPTLGTLGPNAEHKVKVLFNMSLTAPVSVPISQKPPC